MSGRSERNEFEQPAESGRQPQPDSVRRPKSDSQERDSSGAISGPAELQRDHVRDSELTERRPVPAFSQHVPSELYDHTSGTHQVLDGPRRRRYVRPLRQNQRGRGVPQRSGRKGGFGFPASVPKCVEAKQFSSKKRSIGPNGPKFESVAVLEMAATA